MSRQKCMSFSECSNLEAKNVAHFKRCYERDKGRTMISNKQDVKNEAVEVDFTLG